MEFYSYASNGEVAPSAIMNPMSAQLLMNQTKTLAGHTVYVVEKVKGAHQWVSRIGIISLPNANNEQQILFCKSFERHPYNGNVSTRAR